MRPRVLALLDSGLAAPLTVISAPAGFGKTTLLAEWRLSGRGRGLPAAWLPLDGDDNSEAIHQAVTFLIDHLPEQTHLMIATRSDPPLPLARLRAQAELIEIRADNLRFTPDQPVTGLSVTELRYLLT